MPANFNALLKRVREFEESIRDLEEQRKTISEHMAFLEKQGLIYASLHYRSDK